MAKSIRIINHEGGYARLEACIVVLVRLISSASDKAGALGVATWILSPAGNDVIKYGPLLVDVF